MISDKDIQTLFGSVLERISNKDLRDKVVKTWTLGCQRGGWNSVDELRNMPFTLLTKTDGVNFIQHTLAVTEGAYGLAKAQETAYGGKLPYKVDYDRLLAGGLLHDVGKLVETEPDGKGGYRKSRAGACLRHPISGTALAVEAGIKDDTVLNTIACHAKEGEGAPKCLETVLIHQADFATFDPLVMMEKGQLIQ
ncbi:MAG: HD domain-containing protein [Phycisphaerae bacterium]|nr:HD domain-containing protein [Phycisphaerae bacterium]